MLNNFYEKFFNFPINNDLKKLNISSSYFVLNWLKVLKDEDYICLGKSNTDIFIKCYKCNGIKIKTEYVDKKNIYNFLKKVGNYNFEYTSYLKSAIELLTVNDNFIKIDFCEDCGTILNINDNPFFLYYYISATDYERLFQEEGYFGKENEICKCPNCENEKFYLVHTNDGKDIFCQKCEFYYNSFKNNKHYININKLGKTRYEIQEDLI